tara:strand:+ start:665 stop:886 length:222 start_codon:yes stop_codon:yes gene_type:complete
MLNPKDPNDIMSLEKSRNIVKEILDFGTSENEKMKIIELLCLELENTDVMKQIITILKSNQANDADKQKKLIL